MFSFFLQDCHGDVTQLAEDLSFLSLDSTSSASPTAEAWRKLAQLIKTRNIMKFNSHTNGTGQSSSTFCPEDISLLQNIPKGTWKLIIIMLGDLFMLCNTQPNWHACYLGLLCSLG